MMRYGRKHSFGDVIVAEAQFVDTFEIKARPAVVLFEEYGNVVCAAITSNPKMKGIELVKREGALANSVIKLNYIFTISEKMVKKILFTLTKEKKEIVKKELVKKIS